MRNLCGHLLEVPFERVSANVGLCFRETGFCRAETPAPKRPVNFQPIVRRDEVPPRNPANSGLFLGNREISVYRVLRGGAGRTRTANQAVTPPSIFLACTCASEYPKPGIFPRRYFQPGLRACTFSKRGIKFDLDSILRKERVGWQSHQKCIAVQALELINVLFIPMTESRKI